MSIDLGTTQSIVLTVEERTHYVECCAEDGSDYAIKFHRERISRGPDGKVVSINRNLPVIVRTLSQLKAANDPGLSLFISLRDNGDRWAQEVV